MLEGYDINIVETKSVGTNFVDNRISMYIGYMFGKYNPRRVFDSCRASDFKKR